MKAKIAAVAAALIAIVATIGAMILRHDDDLPVPVVTVSRADFQRSVTAEGFLEAEKSTPINVPTEAQDAMKIGWIADDLVAVKKGEIIVRFDPTDFEKELRGGSEERTKADNSIEQKSVNASAVRTGLERDARYAQQELDAARQFSRRDAEIFSRFERVESELDEGLAVERKDYADSVREIRDKVAQTELELLDIQRRQAEMRVGRANKGLAALSVAAPHDGILVLKRDWRGDLPRVGATIWPGRPVGEIPSLDSMKAEVFILEADAGGVEVGQKAKVVVEAAPGKSFSATVSRIDKIAKPRSRGVPVQYFGVTLTLDRTDPAVMKPGARVRATIELAQMKNVLTLPRQAVFEQKGEKVVWLNKNERFTAVPVTVAAATAGRVIVTSGVAHGDVVALTSPGAAAEREKK